MPTDTIILAIFFAAVIVICITALMFNRSAKTPPSEFECFFMRRSIDQRVTTLQRALQFAWANGHHVNAWLIEQRIAAMAKRRKRYEV